MVYDPIADRLVDLVGGQVDLESKLIRAIGSPHSRFEEDRLRMVRAVRFAASLGFTIESETFARIRDLAPHQSELQNYRIFDHRRGENPDLSCWWRQVTNAANVSLSIVNPKLAAKRTARTMRSRSSQNENADYRWRGSTCSLDPLARRRDRQVDLRSDHRPFPLIVKSRRKISSCKLP